MDQWFPGDAVLGEELGGEIAGLTWVIDPIDGTSNFLNGLPIWGVSIGLMDGREPLLGAIALPALGLRLVDGTSLPALPPAGRPSIPTIAVGWNAGLAEHDERHQLATIRAPGFETVAYRLLDRSTFSSIVSDTQSSPSAAARRSRARRATARSRVPRASRTNGARRSSETREVGMRR
nr:inositol monophosphatase family protein [Devosia sp. FKR38]